MYSDKNIVNLLTSLLIAKGIKKAVVCPGSRNIPIISNLRTVKEIECISVIDERSAAFYALGVSLATGTPTIVCVTSGSAFLNTLPAIAEAHYRQVPIILISADRPQEWIERNDGQTMVQCGPTYGLFNSEVDVNDISNGEAENYSSLLINNALNAALRDNRGPVHINIHLHEPLFVFNKTSLPVKKDIEFLQAEKVLPYRAMEIIKDFILSERKIIVIGQLPYHDEEIDMIVKELKMYYIVMCEQLSTASAEPIDAIVDIFEDNSAIENIDMVLSLGNTLVSKNTKRYLRTKKISSLWEINDNGIIHDTFMSQTGIIDCSCKHCLKALLRLTKENYKEKQTEKTGNADDEISQDILKTLWDKAMTHIEMCIDDYVPVYSQMLAIRCFEQSLEDMEYESEVHYANSMEIRIGCLYSPHYIWCNRGVNGIEGSVSTAAGFSLTTSSMVFCITGDLSFFYDQNALWNNHLKGNFRVMILNNNCGGIFSQLKGLNIPDDIMKYVEGRHTATAKGVCEQNDIGYMAVRDEEELRISMAHFLIEKTNRPIVLEVFTSPDDDRQAFVGLKKMIKSKF